MPDDLRHRYAEALAEHMKDPVHRHANDPLHGFVWDWECCADAVLSVRDDVRDAELEQVKSDALVVVAEAADERDGWRERAETAEAKVREYENAISWGTDCIAHATLHDKCRRQEERAEKAERLIAVTRERLDALIASGFGATTDTLRELRAALDATREDGRHDEP